MSGSKIRPFDVGGYFPISNWVFDVAMPRLSNAGWRVLCVAIRKTWGWADPDTSSGRQEWDQISYSQFQEASGLRSRSSVARGIEQCLAAGYLVRRQIGSRSGIESPTFAYSLNLDFEVDAPGTLCVPEDPPTESPGTLSGPGPGTLSGHTKVNKNKHDGGDVQDLLDDLKAFGYNGARKTISQYGADRCREVLTYARRAELGPGWIHVTLRSGEPVPSSRQKVERQEEDRRRRYIEGNYADIIEH